jgi:hypothetical protein
MARIPLAQFNELESARQRAAAFVGDKKAPSKRKRPQRGISKRAAQRFEDEMQAMLSSDQWDEAQAGHFVALFIVLHEWCYSIRPAELVGTEYLGAMSAARRMLNDEFGGRVDGLLDYIRWSWKDEGEREKWRRSNGQQGGLMQWRHLFVQRRKLTHYRIACARAKGE